jgi:hypothetical protein
MAIIETRTLNGEQYVLECNHHANTNGLKLGKTQRAILSHLATAPGGFSSYTARGEVYRTAGHQYRAARNYCLEADLLWHGLPHGIRMPDIATAVYDTEEPTTSQIRVVQRNVRRLQELELVDCWHACAGYVDRPYRCINGEDYVMPQAVAALYAALRWDCEHFAEQDRLVVEWKADAEARIDEMLKSPVAALRGLL